MSERKGLVFVSIAAVLFSVGGLGVKLIPWKGLSISCFRSLLAVVVLLLFAKAIHHPLRLTRGVVIGAVADRFLPMVREKLGKDRFEAGLQPVELRLEIPTYEISDLIDTFGNEVTIKKTGEESCEARITVQDGPGLYFWLLQRADNVKVLSPPSVRDHLVELLKNTLAQYESSKERQ